MKKLISLLLCVMLCMMTLVPAMAEGVVVETPAAFGFALEDYKTFYDTLVTQLAGTPATWTTSEDGKTVTASVEGLCDLQLCLNEEGAMQYMTVLVTAGVSEITPAATAFGMTVALGGMSAMYYVDAAAMMNFETEFNPLLQSLMNNTAAMVTGETAKVTGTVCGLPAVVTMSMNLTDMTMTMGFFYGAEGTVLAE